jgi:CBS domain containing-hemolysin-like protein
MSSPNSYSPLSALLFIFFSVLLNGLYVAAEFSLARCRPSKVESMATNGGFLHKLLLRAVSRLNDYISAAQVGITIASLVLGAIAEPFFSSMLDPLFKSLSVPELLLHPLSFTLSMMVATYIHVVMGEFIPKTLALQYPEQIALATILPLDWSYRVTKPLVWILNTSANSLLKVSGITANNKVVLAYSEEEIKLLVKESQKEGVIERTEEEMVNKVFEFTDTVVREIMTPRTEIIGIEANSGLSKAVDATIINKVSKLPVYEENVDKVIGLVHTADLLKYLQNANHDILVKEIIRPIMRVPESKPIADLLTEFKRDRVQIAIVLDEFGGTAGLVTLEDIVEELVGDIQDEDEAIDEPIIKIADNGYLIESRVLIAEINETLGTNFSDEHFDTIGGYVFGLIGREPKVGDEVKFDSWVFKVEKIERKIEQIRLIKEEILENIELDKEPEEPVKVQNGVSNGH